MRSIRSLIVAVATIVAFAVVVPSASASTVHAFHLTKDCSQYAGTNPSYCTIVSSNVPALSAGTKIWYTGPVVSSSVMVSSNVTIKPSNANSVTGYCQVDARTGVGLCTFWKGTGTLAGFHAVVIVTVDAARLWHWEGNYYFTGK